MNTPRLVALVTFAIALSGCAVTPQKGEFVPIAQLLAENADTPYECTDYNSASDTCEGIGKMALSGDVATSESLVAFDGDDPVQLTILSSHKVDDGKLCGLEGDIEILVDGKKTPRGENFMVDMLGGLMTGMMSEVCISYYRSGDGYYAEATSFDGKVLDELGSQVRFFATPKAVRPLEM